MYLPKKIDKRKLIEERLSDLDIYSRYMPNRFELNKNTNNPFKTDKHPSFKIYYLDGGYFHKSFNSAHKGNVYTFLKDLTGKNYKYILDMVCEDFGLLQTNNTKFQRVISELPKIEKKEKQDHLIQVEPTEWQKRHLNYIGQYGLIPEDLNLYTDTKVFPIKNFWLNREKFNIRPSEVVLNYYIPSLQKNKSYFTSRDKNFKFWSSLPFTYIHGLEDLVECENLIVCKAIKEAALLYKLLKIPTIVAQAENPTAFTKDTIELINSKCKNIYTSFDIDSSGKSASIALNNITGWKWINVPNKYLEEGINDWASLRQYYGSEPIIEHFKLKNLI